MQSHDEDRPAAHGAAKTVVQRGGSSLWLVVIGIGVCVLLSIAWNAFVGVLTLAGVVGGAAVARATLPADHLPGIAVRSRSMDLTILITAATALVVLAFFIPDL